jgi:hypothetical protein
VEHRRKKKVLGLYLKKTDIRAVRLTGPKHIPKAPGELMTSGFLESCVKFWILQLKIKGQVLPVADHSPRKTSK